MDLPDPKLNLRARMAPSELFKSGLVTESLYPCSDQSLDVCCPRKGYVLDQGDVLYMREFLTGDSWRAFADSIPSCGGCQCFIEGGPEPPHQPLLSIYYIPEGLCQG